MVLQHGFGNGKFHAFEHGVHELLLGFGMHLVGLGLRSLLEDHGLQGFEAGEAELLGVVFIHFGKDFAADLAELHAQVNGLAAQGLVDMVFGADHGAGAFLAGLEAADDIVELGEFLAFLGFGELDGVVFDLHAGNGLAVHVAVHVDGDHVAGLGQAFFGHVFEGSGALEQAAGEVGDLFFSELEGGHFHGEGGKVFGELHIGKGIEGEGELQFLAAHDGVAVEFQAGHGLQVFFAEDGGDALFNEDLGGAAHHFAGEALFDDGGGNLALAEAGDGDGSAHFLGGGGEAGVHFFSRDDNADLAVEFGNDFDAVRHDGETPYGWPAARAAAGRWQRVVREERLELSWITPLDPKSSAYANFATLAQNAHCKGMNLTQLCAVGKSGTCCAYWKILCFLPSGGLPERGPVERAGKGGALRGVNAPAVLSLPVSA